MAYIETEHKGGHGYQAQRRTWVPGTPYYNPKTNRELKRKYRMTYNDYLQLMLDAALDIKAGNFDKGYGICGNIDHKVINAMRVKFPGYVIADDEINMNSWRILRRICRTWPKFSGDALFPIADPYEMETADNVFARLPKWTGAYGALRFELLDHIILFLEERN